MQLVAPCATALEGTLLGSEAYVWVGGRTVLSATAAIGILLATSQLRWGLTGIWVGLASLVGVNCALDAFRLLQPNSPLALAQPEADKAPHLQQDALPQTSRKSNK